MTSDVVRWTGINVSKWLWRESVLKSILYEIVVLLLVINCNVSTVKCASTSGLSGGNDWDIDLLSEMTHGHYTPTWAVHIPGGETEADLVAAEHGFVNMGKIFNDHYHFHHNTVQKRSISPSHHHQGRLDGDHRVRWAVQQKAKSRQKRDLIRIRPSRTFSVQLNDPKWPHMWYLNRGNGLDMNVIPAWKEGITGRGIVVTILDDGLESDHPDLERNYDPQASYDVNSHDDDPMPHYDISDSNRHGTRCAGEVAATANNSLCAVGIAFGASVGGVRMLDGDVTDAVEARSLSLNPQHIDIYSASWGPDDDGKTVDGPGELATRAFIEGVKYGRGGKGSIFIWASGNGGREHDNCNCDGYTNSIWTLSISSATEEGAVPWYSEMCSSTLATTYSSGGQGEKQIVTTDLHHSCTTSHTGTSASAPLAAGIVALVLEANSNLTWRDLQHIVVRTAKPGNLNDPTWGRNGVGRRVSHSFGYGLMDAAGMVKLARTWKTVPEQQLCEINAPPLDRVIPPKGQITLTLTVEHCMGVNYLEHVQAKITLTSQRRGDIQIYLTSPAGTRVTLLTSRIHDVSRAGFSLWPFMSVHTWGEAPHGNWQLEIRNEGRYMAQITDWRLLFYGTALPPQPNDPPRFGKPGQLSPDLDHNSLEFEGERASGQWRETHQVGESHVDVQKTASGEVVDHACLSYTPDKKCLECEQGTFLNDGLCYASCPNGTYVAADEVPKSRHREGHVSLRSSTHKSLDPDDDYATLEPQRRAVPSQKILQPKVCLPCHSSCLRCRGPSEAECSACTESYDLVTLKIDSFCLKRPEKRFLGLSKCAFIIVSIVFLTLLCLIPLLVVCYVRKSKISLCFKHTDDYEYNPVTTETDGSFPNFPSVLGSSLSPKGHTLTLSSDSEDEA
ncbi:furin-like protease 1 [Phlebotomus argentipes]|uniref:furin-like protease 1 n=1 Tax=Phlebotomus argentipes TaxID=94469 RepID=UPI00289321CC|nr:furin-like protease 1 [Phlebotomus argentipes]